MPRLAAADRPSRCPSDLLGLRLVGPITWHGQATGREAPEDQLSSVSAHDDAPAESCVPDRRGPGRQRVTVSTVPDLVVCRRSIRRAVRHGRADGPMACRMLCRRHSELMISASTDVTTIGIAETLNEALGMIVTDDQLAFCASGGEQQVQTELLALIDVARNTAEIARQLLEV